MGLQNSVSLSQGYGVPGEIVYDGPVRAAPWTLVSTAQANVVGATAYTGTSEGIAQAGAGGSFGWAGILANPKVYADFAALGSASMTLPDQTIGELVTMGQLLVTLVAAANPGDPVIFDNTSGVLSATPASGAVTASFATNVMTVTGSPTVVLGVGSVVSFTGVAAGTRILSLGSGTGGAGTYNLTTTPGTVGSAAGTATNGGAGTGKSYVPHGHVVLRSSGANGLAIIELTD